jgi:hypothetical protein
MFEICSSSANICASPTRRGAKENDVASHMPRQGGEQSVNGIGAQGRTHHVSRAKKIGMQWVAQKGEPSGHPRME